MKLRWHFLFLIISGAIAGYLLFSWQKPLWELADPRILSFAKADPVKKEWHCIVHDQEKQEFWYETRAGRDPKVIRKLRLQMPATSNKFYAAGQLFLEHSHALLGYENVSVVKEDIPKPEIELRYTLFDEKGRILRPFTLHTTSVGQVTGHGNKLAFVEKGYIVLYDLTTNEERQVKMSKRPFISFSPDGMLLTCQSSYSGSLSLIDWATASVEEVIPYRESVCSCRFVTNTDVIVGFDVRAGFGVDYSHTRYRRYY